jgi:hypothetical protein
MKLIIESLIKYISIDLIVEIREILKSITRKKYNSQINLFYDRLFLNEVFKFQYQYQ